MVFSVEVAMLLTDCWGYLRPTICFKFINGSLKPQRKCLKRFVSFVNTSFGQTYFYVRRLIMFYYVQQPF